MTRRAPILVAAFAVALAVAVEPARADGPPKRAVPSPESPPVSPPVALGATPIDSAPDYPPQPSAAPLRPIRLYVAPSLRLIYESPFIGGQVDVLGGGSEGPRGAWYFRASLFTGSSIFGLVALHPEVGVLGEWKLGRWRVDLGGNVGVLVITRATNGGSMTAVTFGPRMSATCDLLEFGRRRALYAGLDLGVNGVAIAASPLVQVALGIGLRM